MEKVITVTEDTIYFVSSPVKQIQKSKKNVFSKTWLLQEKAQTL